MLTKLIATFLLIIPVTAGVSACAASESVELSAGTVIIDVRTPEEFSAGHLEGAVNIDFRSPDFAAQVGGLDLDTEYFLYCRTGNRSGQALSQMSEMGFSSLTNGGGLEEASSTSGTPIVID